MKKLFILLSLIFVSANLVFADPYYDPNQKVIITDYSYNVQLRKNLEDNFHKKYLVSVEKDKDGNITTHYNYPPDAYHQEVIVPYYNLKKSYEELPKTIR